MNTITAGAIAWEAKTATNNVHIRIHESDGYDDAELRAALPLRTEKASRSEYDRMVETHGELDTVDAYATEWGWDSGDPISRYSVVEIYGPYEVGSRTEWDVAVRVVTDDEMEAARIANSEDPWVDLAIEDYLIRTRH
jgi:hypothetical protein